MARKFFSNTLEKQQQQREYNKQYQRNKRHIKRLGLQIKLKAVRKRQSDIDKLSEVLESKL